MQSRNKREGYYGGTRREYAVIKKLGNGERGFRLLHVKHERLRKSLSLRALFSKASLREFERMLGV